MTDSDTHDGARPDGPDLEELVDRLQATRAGAGYDQLRGEALADLLAVGQAGHDAVLARLEAGGYPGNLLRALPLFERDESVPPIAEMVRSDDAVLAGKAAAALAQHPSPLARDALVAALTSGSPETAATAATALAERGDPTSLPDLAAAQATADPAAVEEISRAIEVLSAPT